MAQPIRLLMTFAAIGLMFLSGCGKSPEPVVSPEPEQPIKDPVVDPKSNPTTDPTEADARQFAKDLEAAFEARNRDRIEELIRYFDIVDLVLRDMPNVDRAVIARVARETIGQRDMASLILRRTEDGGTYKPLRAYQVDGQVHVLFRLISSEGDVGYHDFVLGRGPNGSIRAVDLYIPNSGELASRAIRRMVLPFLNQVPELGLDSVDAEYRKSIPKMNLMAKALRESRFKDAIAIYEQLSANLKEEKLIMLGYVTAVINTDSIGEEAFDAIEMFREKFPNDICLDFVELHHSVAKKQHLRTLAAIDRIDKAVGGDPYLNVLRANSLIELKRYDDAKSHLTQGLEAEPDLLNLYEARLALTLRTKKFDETLEWLKRTVEACKTPIGDLTQAPEYAEFVKSPKHAEWVAWYAKNKKD